MDVSDFLFPRDLEVNALPFPNVLMIGSCLLGGIYKYLKQKHPSNESEYILFNNASTLPERSDEYLRKFDAIYIQIPLRSVLTDAAVRMLDFDGAENRIDWLALGQSRIDAMLEKCTVYSSILRIPTLVSNFVVPQRPLSPSMHEDGSADDLTAVVVSLNAYLRQRINDLDLTFIADVNSIGSSLGKKFFLDDSIVFSTHGDVFFPDWAGHERMPYWTSPEPGRIEPLPSLTEIYENKYTEFYQAILRQIDAFYRSFNQIDSVKVVIFDLDNTLWRGQIVDHYQPGARWPYSDGWPLGIWEAIQHLRRRGIAVAIASKNDESIVRERWSSAVQPGFIKYDDFVLKEINWQPKSESISRILSHLSLRANSAVFVDDNPVEREAVKNNFPDIRVIGTNPFTVRRILLWAPETQIISRTKETRNRETMFRQQLVREEERSKQSREEFLKSLATRVNIWKISSTKGREFSRIFELVNKTNQFNTTGKRWTIGELESFFAVSNAIYAFTVQDKFSDYGTVGAVFVSHSRIVQFVMSCRVLGMEIEDSVLKFIIAKLRASGDDSEITGSIVENESNSPCRDLFSKIGFSRVEGASENYRLSANEFATSSSSSVAIEELT